MVTNRPNAATWTGVRERRKRGGWGIPLTPLIPPFHRDSRHSMHTYFFQSVNRGKIPQTGKEAVCLYEHSVV